MLFPENVIQKNRTNVKWTNVDWTNVTWTNIAWTNAPNSLNHLRFVKLGWLPNLGFLEYVEVRKKDVLRVGGWVGGGWRVGGSWSRIMPRCGSILQAETCQILSLAEDPRWS